ncbi:MAG TPA: DegT/DnrJ/EryC1/StrS family aminotransferase [Mycobacteriales bacterium]|nr:DegT/DnrJ/EryC1/StrS family aminotransferase [Mycobacteriales bacterium]
MIRFLDLRAVHEAIADELAAAVQRVVASGWYILGPEVEAFEAEWAAYVGARHCVSVGNGLDALTLTLRAFGVGAGDEVVVPSHTFVATWLAVAATGATPVPAEVDPETFNLRSYEVGERTRAVIPVHLYGQPARYADADVPVVEDAAQAHGARLDGVRVGGHGVTACWSFYPGKNLGALGDGGAVTTDDPAVAQSLRLLRNYGSSRKYVHEQAGVNSRLDDVQAAALRVKLRHLDAWNARRAEIAARYTEALRDVVATPAVEPGSEPVWHLYVVRSPDRDGLAARLAERGVETLIHYPTPPHQQAAFATGASLPVAERLAAEVLSLPMGPHLSDADVDAVIAAVRDAS